ncbi:CU044_5270 family protein [Micromonospora sp. NPDC006766]|uniref:CU044_5270 family protein n=1 Tax=Micromonospora sp. NPDC006766 TaxID=3154778 RepID=UPI0033D75B46
MTMIKDLGEALATEPHSPSGLRHRVLSSTRPGTATVGRRSWLGRRGLVPVTAFAAVLLAATLVVYGRGGPVEPVDASADAPRLLLAAAETALAGPDLAPRPDQFVYVESVGSTMVEEYTGGLRDRLRLTGHHQESHERQVWWSVDGTRDGLVRLRPRGSDGVWEDLSLTAPQPPAAPAGLPEDAAGMREYLYRNSHGANPADQQAFITLGDLIKESYVPPRVLAAAFQAAAEIPGVEVVPHAVDAAGRPGVAVAREDDGLRAELIFDATTYRFLGARTIVVGRFEYLPRGTVRHASAVLRLAVVDQAGQHP